MIRLVWAQDAHRRRPYLVDATCQFIAPVKAFLDGLARQERSPSTLESYCRHLKHYFTFLEEHALLWSAVTHDDLLRFVEWLRVVRHRPDGTHRQMSARSVNTVLAALASFYRYHLQHGQMTDTPLGSHQVPARFRPFKPFLVHTQRGTIDKRDLILRVPKKRIHVLSEEQFARFQASTDNLQFRCILFLMRDGGLRTGEVLGLQLQDIEFHRNGVVIRRRTRLANGALAKRLVEGEEHFVELTPAVMALLDQLVLQHTYATDHVFVVQHHAAHNRQGEATYGTPLTRDALKALFRYYSAKSGIPLHAHLLRHTHATELIRAGWDASYVQQRLGHAQVQTTINTYVHLTDQDMSQKWRAYQEEKQHAH